MGTKQSHKVGKRRQAILKARAAARASYATSIEAAKQRGAVVPSKYRLRAQARQRGEPMRSRTDESRPWHFPLTDKARRDAEHYVACWVDSRNLARAA